jgi:hypothetical protein
MKETLNTNGNGNCANRHPLPAVFTEYLKRRLKQHNMDIRTYPEKSQYYIGAIVELEYLLDEVENGRFSK